MKLIDTEQAVGHVLCHDMTEIVRGVRKGPRFRKGHIVTAEDIPVLLRMGKKKLYIWEKTEGMLHENEGAERLCALCGTENMEKTEVKEGKIELIAACDGLFSVDRARLDAVNDLEPVMIATRHGNTAVHRGDKLAGMRVIPLVVEERVLDEAAARAGDAPLLSLTPWRLRTCGLVTTGSEVAEGLIEDTFTPVIREKLAAFGIEVTHHCLPGDDRAAIAQAVRRFHEDGVDLILCTGGMSVDPDDRTPAAIRDSGAEVVTYGAPVLPGAMLLIAYFADGTPVLGLPGCVMYAAATVFDLVMPRVAAGVRLTRADVRGMGEGGLCLGCKECRYPVCPFGKG